ncbi:MAG: uncharacterized protein KVP18_002621 [Porospora cf. gigantea A]|uniref:uncharacterized protein n=1 Tax=Porospora cf. gigantea A TaxID=2853593 RepID=UPI00355975B5|nr:MAG: hypothetical protein KVP18_002621 [Porospora cf. gigantea A]
MEISKMVKKNAKLSTWDRVKATLLKVPAAKYVSSIAISKAVSTAYPEVSKDNGFKARLRGVLKKKVEEKVLVQKKASFRFPAAAREEKKVKKVIKKKAVAKKPAAKKPAAKKPAAKKPASKKADKPAKKAAPKKTAPKKKPAPKKAKPKSK